MVETELKRGTKRKNKALCLSCSYYQYLTTHHYFCHYFEETYPETSLAARCPQYKVTYVLRTPFQTYVPGYGKKYLINKNGIIINAKTKRMIIPHSKYRGRYPCVNLVKEDGKPKFEYVHRLLALAFIPNPNNYKFVRCHSGSYESPSILNLYWTPHQRDKR